MAALVLWRVWRRIERLPRRFVWIIAIGFAIRAIGGQLLFWISWLHLPLGRSLQLDNGLWFYAPDGAWYFTYARSFAAEGLAGVLRVPDTLPAPPFVRALTLFDVLFGSVTPVALLFNCVCYLVTAVLIVALGRSRPRLAVPATVALLAVTLSPSGVLWSLQPLKDPFFIMLIAGFAFTAVWWTDMLKRGARSGDGWRIAGGLMLWFALLSVIGGLRWYAALPLWAGFPLFVAVGTVQARRQSRARVLSAGVVAFAVLWMAFVFGSYIPDALRPFVFPTHAESGPSLVSRSVELLQTTRRGFDNTVGHTAIAAGPLLRASATRSQQPAAQPAAPPPAPPTLASIATAPPSDARSTENATSASGTADPQSSAHAPTLSANSPTAAAAAPPKIAETAAPLPEVAETAAATPKIAGTSADQPRIVDTPAAAPTPAPSPSAPQPSVREPALPRTPLERQRITPTAAPKRTERSNPHAAPAEPQTLPAPSAAAKWHVSDGTAAATSTELELQRAMMPASPAGRFAAGAAAMFLPRALAQALGLVRIGGGRGFWAVADVDTLAIDALLLYVLFACARHLRRSPTDFSPAFFLIALHVTGMLVAAMYSVSNFGTLFRMRGFMAAELCLLPLLLPRARPAEESLATGAGTGA